MKAKIKHTKYGWSWLLTIGKKIVAQSTNPILYTSEDECIKALQKIISATRKGDVELWEDGEVIASDVNAYGD